MPESLTRALLLARKCWQSLVLTCGGIVDRIRWKAPVVRHAVVFRIQKIRDETSRLCRIGLEITGRFIYRLYFRAAVLCIKIADSFRYWTPIVRDHIANVYLLCVARTWRFIYRLYFFGDVLCIRIADWFRYWTPIIRDRISGFYLLCLARTWRFIYRIYFFTVVLCTRITEWFRHWTPIVLHFLRTQLQNLGQVLSTFTRALIRHTINISRTIAQAVVNASVRISRLIYGAFCSFFLAILAGGRWLAGRVRHYVPLLLQAADKGVQATAQAVIAVCRAALQLAARILTATARGIRSAITAIINVLQILLLAVIHLLRLVAQAIFSSTRVILRYAALAVSGLWRHLRILSSRAGERLYQYTLLMRLNKPIGIFLLLWPTLWALWIAADGTPDLHILIIFVVGVVLMRSAGVIINDYADRDFDTHVSRTRDRPLASGKVTPKEALKVAALLVLCAFLLVLQLNLLTIGLSFIAVVLAAIYPFMKRYTYMPQFFLGLAFGWAVPMAFAAQTGSVPAMGWVLMLATVMWALVYDTMYAMVDREEDIELGIKSTAILFEEADRVIIAIIQLLVVLTLLLIGTRLDFNRYYYAGLAIAALLFLYQQHLIRDRAPQHCFMAFINNNWFGAMVFGGILMNYQYG